MQIIAKIKRILFKQNCMLCKQSSDDIICKYCFNTFSEQLNFNKQSIELDYQEYDYYHLLVYSPEVKYLLQKFKFQKDLLSGSVFSKLICQWWSTLDESSVLRTVDSIAVIPIHRFRYLYRGFNQSELVAKSLSEYTSVSTTFENYSRVKYTRSQAKSSKKNRESQIQEAFKLHRAIRSRHLLIIDDVLTTGSTMKEFIKSINKEGHIEKISILTLVRPV